MISICAPTRKRTKRFKKFLRNVINLADNPDDIEILTYIDDDDQESLCYAESIKKEYNLKIYSGKRMGNGHQSDMYNYLYTKASGNIVGYFADDVRFMTKGWDTIVKESFIGDQIWLVCPYERHVGAKYAMHGFLSRKGIEIVGNLYPPYFAAYCPDKWLLEVYKPLGRHKVLRNVRVSHDNPQLYYSGRIKNNKKPDMSLASIPDDTYLAKNTDEIIGNDRAIYNEKYKEREEWINKLMEHME